jgi:hypothetical protein
MLVLLAIASGSFSGCVFGTLVFTVVRWLIPHTHTPREVQLVFGPLSASLLFGLSFATTVALGLVVLSPEEAAVHYTISAVVGVLVLFGRRRSPGGTGRQSGER